MSTTTTRLEGGAVDHDDATSVRDPADDTSWVDRCQRQFTSGTERLPNLADDTNHAMPDGG